MMWFCSALGLAFYVTLVTSCVLYDVTYDAEEYGFLCTRDLSVAELIVQEILQQNSSAVDKEFLDELTEKQLDDIAAIGRETITDLYLKHTCDKDMLCRPYLTPPDQTAVLFSPRFHEITAARVEKILQFSDPVQDMQLINSPYNVLLTISHPGFKDIELFTLSQDGFVKATNFVPYPGNCFASTENRWGLPLLLSTRCRIPEEHNEETISYIYKTTEAGLEMMQMLLTPAIVSAVDIYWENGSPHLLLMSPGNGYQYKWDSLKFDLNHVHPFPTARRVKTFRIDDKDFFAVLNFPSVVPSTVQIFLKSSMADNLHRYTIYQRLSYCDASDILHFTISNLHFLAVACASEYDSYLFWWSGSQFLLWQSIPSRKAISWSIAYLPNLELILVLLENSENEDYSIRFFQLNDGFFYPRGVTISLHDVSSSRIVSFINNGTTYLATTGRLAKAGERMKLEDNREPLSPGVITIFKLEVLIREDPQSYRNQQVINCIADLEFQIDEEWHRLQNLERSFKEVLVTDRKQIVMGEKRFLQGLNIHDLTVENILLGPDVELNPRDDFHCLYCDQQLHQLHQEIEHLLAMTSDFVKFSDENLITGRKTIQADVTMDEGRINSLKTELKCGDEVIDISAPYLTKMGEQVISQVTTIMGNVTAESVEFLQTINGVYIKDLATLSGDHVFTAPQTFENFEATHVQLLGKINDIDPKSIVVHDQFQVIEGHKIIKGDLIVRGNILSQTFNQINLTEYFDSIVTTDTRQVIDVDVEFTKGFLAPDIQIGFLNGVNFTEFASSTLHRDGEQIITGPYEFNDLVIKGEATFSTINNIDLNKDLLTKYTEQIIEDEVIIQNDIIARENVTVVTTVNNLDLDQDIVTVTGDHNVTGLKIFQKPVTILDNITMVEGGLVNGVDLSELRLPTAYAEQVKVDHLETDFLNGLDVRQWLAHLLRKSVNQTITAPYTFTDVTFADILVDGYIAGFKPERDFITTSTFQMIERETIFDENVLIQGDIVMAEDQKINGQDLSQFSDAVVKIFGDQTIDGSLIFFSNVTVHGNVLMASGAKVNGLDLSEEAFHLNKEQNITGIVEAHHIEAEQIVVDDIQVTWLNSFHPDDFFRRTVYAHKGEYIIQSTKTFLQNVIVNNVRIDVINNININKLEKNIVRKTTLQHITGNFYFHGGIEFQANVFVKNINGYAWTEIMDQLVTVDENTVLDPVIFTSCMHIHNLNRIVSLNGINWNELQQNILRTTQSHVFYQPITIDGDIFIDELFTNSLDNVLIDDIALIDKHTIFPGALYFDKDIHFFNVTAQDLNGIDLEMLKQKAVKKTDAVIKGTKTFTEAHVQNIFIDGLINGINISDIRNRLLSKERDQVITGNVIFKNTIVINVMETKALINGINITNMARRALTKHGKQTITAVKHFISPDGIILKNNLYVEKISSVHTIDGVDINRLERTAVYKDGDQTIMGEIVFEEPVEFSSDLEVKGTINGIRIPEDLVLKSKEQIIKGTKKFTNFFVNNLIIEGDLNGRNFSRFLEERMTRSKDEVITSPVVFHGPVNVKNDLIIHGTFNGLRCEDLVFKRSNQEITGHKTFTNVFIRNLHAQYINNYHWFSIIERVNNIIDRDWAIHEDVVFEKELLVDGIWEPDTRIIGEIKQFGSKMNRLNHIITHQERQNEIWLDTSRQCISETKLQLSKLSCFIDDLNLIQRLHPASMATEFLLNHEIYLVLIDPKVDKIFNCKNAIIYKCSNLPRNSCNLTPVDLGLPSYSTRKIKTFQGEGILLISLQNPSVGQRFCEEKPLLYGMNFYIITEMSPPQVLQISKEWVESVSVLPRKEWSIAALGFQGLLEIRNIRCSSTCESTVKSIIPISHGKPIALSWFYFDGAPHLLVLNNINITTGSKHTLSSIFKLLDEMNLKLTLSHTFFTTSATDGLGFNIDRQSLLAIASVDCASDVKASRITIYEVHKETLMIIQYIGLSANSLAVTTSLGRTYLFACSVYDDVYVYRWEGFMTFNFWTRIRAKQPLSVHPFHVNNRLHLIISTPEETILSAASVNGMENDINTTLK